jgi:murein DD-endopeptidase MepM/ murein hydrolase activator NlpD
LQNSLGQINAQYIQPSTIINLSNYYIAQAAINAKQHNYQEQSKYLKKWSFTNSLLEEYKNRVVLPTKGFTITSKYGYRTHPITHLKQFHQGIDINTSKDSIYSIFYGRVTKIGYTSVIGNFIEITGKEYTATYGHLSAILIEEGLTTYPNEIIAISGTTGRSTGDHLHLTIKKGNKTIDPLKYFTDNLTKQR